MVATAPAPLKGPRPLTLPVGIRLEMMRFVGPILAGTDRMAMNTLRVADGPHTGITGKISEVDGHNLARERP